MTQSCFRVFKLGSQGSGRGFRNSGYLIGVVIIRGSYYLFTQTPIWALFNLRHLGQPASCECGEQANSKGSVATSLLEVALA